MTLEDLIKRCKWGMYLSVNDHRGNRTVDEYLDFHEAEVAADVRSRMTELDTVIALQFYPDTTIGSYSVYHHDLQAVLDEAAACLKQQGG